MGIRRPRSVGLLALLLLALLVAPAVAQSPASSPTAAAADDSKELWTAVAAVLDPDARRGAIRLPSVRIDQTGDATVVFALRDEGSAGAIIARGRADTLAILRAVYHSPVADHVRTVTVLGTYAITSANGRREQPVLRATLTRQRAAGLDWQRLNPADLPAAVDEWWLYPPLLAAALAEGTPVASPAASPVATPVATPAASPAATEPVISSLIDIGGRHLFLRCIGTGRPTVILEAGYGDDGTMWEPVQLAVAEQTRVCSYDRAGANRSDPPDKRPRTAADVVADLHALLTAAGVAPPYVLVGHSEGGLFVRLFAATYPAEVVGMVLVDAWPETYDTRLRALVGDRLWTLYQAMLASEPDEETIDLAASAAQVQAAPLPRPMPLIVISHGQPPAPDCCPPGWPVAAAEALWQELQTRLVRLVPGGVRIIARQSGHQILWSQPDLVAAAIEQVVAAVRAGRTSLATPAA